jgi:uncharacterized protein YjbI with pentapeptide repeats
MHILLVIGALLAVGLASWVSGYASALPSLYGDLTSSTRVQLVGLVESVLMIATMTLLWKAGLSRSLVIVVGSLAIFTAVVMIKGRGDDSPAAVVILTVLNFIFLATVLLTGFSLVLLHTLLRGRVWFLLLPAMATPLIISGIQEGVKISHTETARLDFFQQLVMAVLVLMFAVLSVLIAIRAIKGSSAFRGLRELSTAITCSFGTNFRDACLDEANFTGACLPQCDFRGASLHRTRWQSVRLLEECRLEGTYLHEVHVRNLLITNCGARENYDNLSLRDLNLDGVNLEQASLIAADLSGSTLREANLGGCRLAETRMYGVNLQKANLTKSCIENWAISTDTCLDDVICSEVYLRLPTDEDPDPWRKPDNRDDSFKPGDFKDFVAPIVRTLGLYRTQNLDLREVGRSMRTLDLYHYDDINPTAAVVAMHQLAAQNPDTAMELVSLEGKGEEKVHLQAVITGSTSSSRLSRQYQELYQNASALPSNQLQELMNSIAEQSEKLSHMETLLQTAKQTQTNYYIKAGEISGIVNFGEISGNAVNNN